MYFENREQAGKILADELAKQYRYEDCAVVALSDGGVVVGEQIAKSLHCILNMLIVEDIEVPGEGISLGSITQVGEFTSSSSLSDGEVDYYSSEYHGFLEEQKREAFQRINRLIGDGGVIDASFLRDRVIILASDCMDSSSSLDAAVQFLKPIRIKKLIIATPIATIQVVDKLHVAADELHILDVKTNFMGADHYYDQNDVPSREESISKINQIILNWR